MRRRMIVSILVGLALTLSTFINAVSIVQMIAYAQGSHSLDVSKGGLGFAIAAVTKFRAHKNPGTSVHNIQHNIQQTLQKIQNIASASGVAAGVLLAGAIAHALKQHQHHIQPPHVIPIIPKIHP